MTGKGWFTVDERPRPIFRFLLSAFLVFCAYLGTGIFLGIVFRLFGLLPDLYLSLFLVELLLAVVLTCLGVVMVYSSSSIVAAASCAVTMFSTIATSAAISPSSRSSSAA